MSNNSLSYRHGTVIVDTRANILALKTGGSLLYDTLYQINDNTNAEGGDLILTPDSPSSFKAEIVYIPNYDNTQRWFGTYNIDTNLIQELRDNRDNIVIGQVGVNNFLWDATTHPNVTGNYIRNVASLSLTLDATSSLINNRFERDSNININVSGAGFVYENTIETDSSFTVTTATANIESNRVEDDSQLSINANSGFVLRNKVTKSSIFNIAIAAGVASVNNNNVDEDSNVTLTNSGMDFFGNKIGNISTLTITDFAKGAAGSFSRNKIENGSSVQINTCTNVLKDDNIFSSSNITINGSVNSSKNIITNGSTVVATGSSGDINNNEIRSSTVDLTAAATTFIRNTIKSFSDWTILNSGVSLNATDNFIDNASAIYTDQSTIPFLYNTITNGGYVEVIDTLVGGSGDISNNNLTYCNISINDNSGIDFNNNNVRAADVNIVSSTGGTVTQNEFELRSTVTIDSMAGGLFRGNRFAGEDTNISFVNVFGTLNNINSNEFVNVGSSSLNNLTDCLIEECRFSNGILNFLSISNIDIIDSSIDGNSSITLNNSQNLNFSRNSIKNSGAFTVQSDLSTKTIQNNSFNGGAFDIINGVGGFSAQVIGNIFSQSNIDIDTPSLLMSNNNIFNSIINIQQPLITALLQFFNNNLNNSNVLSQNSSGSFSTNSANGGDIDLINCDSTIYQNVVNNSIFYLDDIVDSIIDQNVVESFSQISLTLFNAVTFRFNDAKNASQITLNNVSSLGGTEIRANSITNESVLSNTNPIAGNIRNNIVSNTSSISITSNHDGDMNNNCFRAVSTITGGANGGVSHNNNIVAASAKAFVAAVSENNTRLND